MEAFFGRLHERRETMKKQNRLKRHKWRQDEHDVRNSSCDFYVKYLGSIGVNESKGTHVIKNSIGLLKYGFHGSHTKCCGSKEKSGSSTIPRYGILRISGDGLTFVEDNSEDVAVQAAVDKISFCAPVEHGKYFGFICRQDDDWKWFCHVFRVIDDHAERINNAVGCAFHARLEKRCRERMSQGGGGGVGGGGSLGRPPQGVAGRQSSSIVVPSGNIHASASGVSSSVSFTQTRGSNEHDVELLHYRQFETRKATTST